MGKGFCMFKYFILGHTWLGCSGLTPSYALLVGFIGPFWFWGSCKKSTLLSFWLLAHPRKAPYSLYYLSDTWAFDYLKFTQLPHSTNIRARGEYGK